MTFSRKSDILRWLLTLITGFLCGLVAIFVSYFTKKLSSFKFDTFNALIESEKLNETPFGSAYLFYFLCNLSFGLVAWFMVFLEPLASGSGILYDLKVNLTAQYVHTYIHTYKMMMMIINTITIEC